MRENGTRAPAGAAERLLPEDGVAKGFTLVELLVSMVLFSIVIASATGLLMSQRNLYDVQNDKIALQTSVRAAVDLVASELRMIP
ncbi:MAG TPA: prepilin-type N-terminal cleavage/methylation domain-containing protein, partial [Longimicrobiales bacterium]|nr:prepilin-type N-terminal cleavage/methylation domain-containing protein [Longimicrobiales bacterium]